jgi:uncharacterized protein YfaT (DUF1175 family)
MKILPICIYFLLGLFIELYDLAASATPRLKQGKGIPSLRKDIEREDFPDAVRLTSPVDQYNFRRWFTFIAELQFYRPSRRWNEVNYDCAGLVRYAFVEALKKHTPQWYQSMGLSGPIAIPDVKKYNYPEVPILGVRVFRIKGGKEYGGRGVWGMEVGKYGGGRVWGYGGISFLLPYFPTPTLSHTPTLPHSHTSLEFNVAADAYHLMAYNTVFLGKEDDVAQKGDLLFFLNEHNPNMPYHVMIFVGAEEGVMGGAKDWLVYHTGPDKNSPGEVRKVQRSLLKQHPDPKWRPVLNNPHFLGYFRWKILD